MPGSIKGKKTQTLQKANKHWFLSFPFSTALHLPHTCISEGFSMKSQCRQTDEKGRPASKQKKKRKEKRRGEDIITYQSPIDTKHNARIHTGRPTGCFSQPYYDVCTHTQFSCIGTYVCIHMFASIHMIVHAHTYTPIYTYRHTCAHMHKFSPHM